MKTFAVLTVSKRDGWFDGASEQMLKQTVHPNRWVVVQEGLKKESITHTTPILALYKAPKKIRASNLNASLNHGLRHIPEQYVIFYQDFIELPEDCFEKLIALASPDTLITTCTPNYDGSDDSRFLGIGLPHSCRPEEWETNVAIAPMSMLRELGGFEEKLDTGWSWDNVNVAQRAAMIGAKFIIDESNRPKLLDHEQTSKLEFATNGGLNDKLIRETRLGKRPTNVGYL